MTFTLLPAVDVSDGRVIRLSSGDAAIEDTEVGPLDAARAWQDEGAKWIHLVDIDAAFGIGSNAELLAAVIGELDVNVELSGGIGDDVSLERALSTGCERVVVGAAALHDLDWCVRTIAAHGDRIAVALDTNVTEAEDGSVGYELTPRGSDNTRVSFDLWDTMEQLDREGCVRYIVTDVGADGMLSGPNLDLYREVTAATRTPIIASGGVSAISDLVTLAKTGARLTNLEGVIVGKALYADRFTLPEAIHAVHKIVGP